MTLAPQGLVGRSVTAPGGACSRKPLRLAPTGLPWSLPATTEPEAAPCWAAGMAQPLRAASRLTASSHRLALPEKRCAGYVMGNPCGLEASCQRPSLSWGLSNAMGVSGTLPPGDCSGRFPDPEVVCNEIGRASC